VMKLKLYKALYAEGVRIQTIDADIRRAERALKARKGG